MSISEDLARTSSEAGFAEMFTDFPRGSSKQGSQQSRSSSAVTPVFFSLFVPCYCGEETTTHELNSTFNLPLVVSLYIPLYSRLGSNLLTQLFVRIHVCSRRVSKKAYMFIDCESVYSSSSAVKQSIKRNITRKKK